MRRSWRYRAWLLWTWILLSEEWLDICRYLLCRTDHYWQCCWWFTWWNHILFLPHSLKDVWENWDIHGCNFIDFSRIRFRVGIYCVHVFASKMATVQIHFSSSRYGGVFFVFFAFFGVVACGASSSSSSFSSSGDWNMLSSYFFTPRRCMRSFFILAISVCMPSVCFRT